MAEPQVPTVPRPKTPILTGVPDIVQEDDEDEDPAVTPRRLYFADSMQVININWVYTADDLIPEYPQRSFRPAMVHQIFDQDGIIYGYRNLNIAIYFLATTAKCFVDLQYTEVTSADMPNHSEPDDIVQKLSLWLPEDCFLNKKQFIAEINKESNVLSHGYPFERVQLYNDNDKTMYTYTFTVCVANDSEFRKLHARFQCLLVWFIDGASQIDLDDPNWMFVYVYETRRKNGYYDTSREYPVGFATIYKFFHYPDKIRARISQLFVIPPCQGMGIGTLLLKNVYSLIGKLNNVVDITVEEPCVSFTRMRDSLDCRLLMQLESFKRSVIHNGFTNAMYTEANNHYKINKRQTRRIYEILRFAYIKCDPQDVNYLQICNEIRNRLKVPFMKELRSLEKRKAWGLVANKLAKPAETMACVEANIRKYIKEITETACRFNNKFLEEEEDV